LEAVDNAFDIDVDLAQLIKFYGGETGQDRPRRYFPAECTGIRKRTVAVKAVEADIFTFHVERQNLNMRTGMRPFTRLTNVFSKMLASRVHT
jgi:hypothetical protein